MPIIDLSLAVLVGAFVFFGLFFGLVHTLGSTVGSIVGIVIASRLVGTAVTMFGFLFGGNEGIARIILFILIFLFVSRAIGFVFWVGEKLFGFIKWIPFAKTINRLAGAVLGFVEGVIVVGMSVYFVMATLPTSGLAMWLQSSNGAKYLLQAVKALQALLPPELQHLVPLL